MRKMLEGNLEEEEEPEQDSIGLDQTATQSLEPAKSKYTTAEQTQDHIELKDLGHEEPTQVVANTVVSDEESKESDHSETPNKADASLAVAGSAV